MDYRRVESHCGKQNDFEKTTPFMELLQIRLQLEMSFSEAIFTYRLMSFANSKQRYCWIVIYIYIY